mmetsp:Transcript_76474/g.127428  ORF Transcript_76474/g.127428 Transcript_76474/m.127428 type:complete len:228 (+) Transcript_76474:31-714(+)
MHIKFVPLLLIAAIWPTTQKKAYSDFKLSSLKRMLEVRGVTCETCSSKADWVKKVEESAALPVDPHLEDEYKRRSEYNKQVRQFNMSREEFFRQMNETETDNPLDGPRAERLWKAYQDQLRTGKAKFEDGHVHFLMPVTHKLSPYLHPAVADTIEHAFSIALSFYSRLPPKRQSEIEHTLTWMIDNHVLHAIVVLLLTFICIDVCLDFRRGKGDSKGTTIASKEKPQ